MPPISKPFAEQGTRASAPEAARSAARTPHERAPAVAAGEQAMKQADGRPPLGSRDAAPLALIAAFQILLGDFCS